MTSTDLRTARERLGLTQQDVAGALGVDLRTYRRWELGERPVPSQFAPEAAVMVLRLWLAVSA